MGLSSELYFFEYHVADRDLNGADVVAVSAEHGIFNNMFAVGGMIEEVVAHDVDRGVFLGIGIHGAYGFAFAAFDAIESFSEDAVLHDVRYPVVVEEYSDLHRGVGESLFRVCEIRFYEREGTVDKFHVFGKILLLLGVGAEVQYGFKVRGFVE